MPLRKAAPVYYPAGNAYRRSCRRRSFARLRGVSYLLGARMENDKYFLYLRLKENLFTKRFGLAFLINTLTVMLFM